MFEVGSWYISGGIVYVRVNTQGTVRKLHKIKWYKRLSLSLWQAIGKKSICRKCLNIWKIQKRKNQNNKAPESLLVAKHENSRKEFS
jgi:hypothetical protein